MPVDAVTPPKDEQSAVESSGYQPLPDPDPAETRDWLDSHPTGFWNPRVPSVPAIC